MDRDRRALYEVGPMRDCTTPDLTTIVDAHARFAFALISDAPTAVASKEFSLCPRTGALVVSAPLTWVGMRLVPWRGKKLRMYRSQAGVNSTSYRKTLRALVATLGHPDVEIDGKLTPGFVHALAGDPHAPAPPPGYVWVKPEHVQVGYTGDEITDIVRDGFTLPLAKIYVTGREAQNLIRAGLTQTSLGHMSLLDFTPGSFKDPVTGEMVEYDCEQVLDKDDPRIKEAVEAGLVSQEFLDQIGGNHFAVAIALGRGLGMAELEAIGIIDAGEGEWPLVFRIMPSGDGTEASHYGILWPDRSITVRTTATPPQETGYDALGSFAEAHLLPGGTRIEFAVGPQRSLPSTTDQAPVPPQPAPAPVSEPAPQQDTLEVPTMKPITLSTGRHAQAHFLAAINKANVKGLTASAMGDAAVTLEFPEGFDVASVPPMLTSIAEAFAATANTAVDAQAKLAIEEQKTAQQTAQMDSLRKEAEAGRVVLRQKTIEQARELASSVQATLSDEELKGCTTDAAIKKLALSKIVPTHAALSDAVVDPVFEATAANIAKSKQPAGNSDRSDRNDGNGRKPPKPTDDPIHAGNHDSGDDDAPGGMFG